MTLVNVGTAFRGIIGPPIRFALRIYVPQEELDAEYAPAIPRALDPFEGGVHELTEQLSRLADPSDTPLPPAREPLWTIPFSAAPAAESRFVGGMGDFPVFHAPQRLRRSLRLFSDATMNDGAQLLPLLVPEKKVRDAAREISGELFEPLYTRESAYVVPLAWFAAFAMEDRVVSSHAGHEVHRLIAPADTAARRVIQGAQIVEDTALASADPNADELSEEAQQAKAFADDLTRLGRWLGTFSPASLVCLDYGSLADRIQPDESPRDMADALELLRADDQGAATAALRRIFQRWSPLAHLQSAN
ncbi:hypothetical protein [Kocuria carniphila]|uniref:hypothetical protein n=1 Tax=Kocuria carniphila TaxID=262208 RepID=UPI00101C94DA|nr:hypothetical protein [Kocuria carniphila]